MLICAALTAAAVVTTGTVRLVVKRRKTSVSIQSAQQSFLTSKLEVGRVYRHTIQACEVRRFHFQRRPEVERERETGERLRMKTKQSELLRNVRCPVVSWTDMTRILTRSWQAATASRSAAVPRKAARKYATAWACTSSPRHQFCIKDEPTRPVCLRTL